ncbi:MAG: MBL fold metallo-hydrolase [Labilithrix sp.]|nr:MBL fold metallo-hydrolase [Labilithrix sp.]MCW5809964.1 MBL fold metallo-hydrolase [Labilithrix sp.]
MSVETFPTGPLGCNCSLVIDGASKRAIVVDPGGDFERIAAKLDAAGASVDAIVHTHTHIDHVGATAPLQRKSGARACIHESDRFLYDLLPVQAAMLGIELPETVEMEGSLTDASSLSAGAVEMGVLHTPGHTPGSVTFVVKTPDATHVFSGDTLFRRGIGRTDLWGGDSAQIMRSLKERILALPDDAIVIAGHGPNTTIGEERAANPFLRRA